MPRIMEIDVYMQQIQGLTRMTDDGLERAIIVTRMIDIKLTLKNCYQLSLLILASNKKNIERAFTDLKLCVCKANM